MTGGSIKVVDVRAEDILWNFGTEPRYTYGRNNGYSQAIDPFPAYAHDSSLVFFELRHCQAVWELEVDVVFHVAPYEDVNRVNGWSLVETIWGRGDDLNKYIGHVLLSGKRIPPHPAVTRYLVAHEYGHHVQWDIERRRGLQTNALLEEYAEMRGLTDHPMLGTGGVWHKAVGEIFACDFRTLVLGVEMEYWPHGNVPKANILHRAADWWQAELDATRAGSVA